MHLKYIQLELARNPGDDEHIGSPSHYRYILTAPLTPDGHLDRQLWERNKEKCVFTHFLPDEPERHGKITHRGGGWQLHYNGADPAEDEKPHKLDRHVMLEGEYLTINEPDGDAWTYKVTRVWKGPKAD